MKTRTFVLQILGIAASVSAQTMVVLPDMRQPHQVAVDGNDLYVFDEADYSLHVYTISPFVPEAEDRPKRRRPP